MAQTDKQAQKQGVLPSQAIRAMVDAESIRASRKITDDQIQPASLDLRLGATAYRVRASFLAGSDNKVADRLPRFQMHAVDSSFGCPPAHPSCGELDGVLMAFACLCI